MALGAKTPIAMAAFALLLPMAAGRGLRAGDLPADRRAIGRPRTDALPPALPEPPPRASAAPPAGSAAEGEAPSPPVVERPAPPVPMSLEEAIRQALANVETVKANVAVQTATVARFEALKEFVPLVNLPQLAVAFNQLAGPGKILIFPDVTGGALLQCSPLLQQATLNRANMYFPY